MTAHLVITFDNGRSADMGPAARPHDGIGTVRELFAAYDAVAYAEWRDPDTGHVAFQAARVVGADTFGWKSPAMAGWAFAPIMEGVNNARVG